MRLILAAALLLTLGFCLAPSVTADGTLTPAARELLKSLADANRTGEAGAGGIKIAALSAPLFCQGMLDCLAKPGLLSADEQSLLRKLVSVRFTERGWFLNTEVQAATYYLGFERGANQYEVTLSDAEGKVLYRDAFTVEVPTDFPAKVFATPSGDSVLAAFSCGAIRFEYRFVSAATHERITAEASKIYRHGRITLHSDLETKPQLEALAVELGDALAIHEGLHGVAKIEGEFHFYLVRKFEIYSAIDKALTGGAFQTNGGFASQLTHRTYIHYYPMLNAEALRDAGIPLSLRATCIHELNHLVAYLGREGSSAWPRWLAEGLAELGAQLALKAKSAEEGAEFHQIMLAQWRSADASGSSPPLVDLLGGFIGERVRGFYGSAYLLAKKLNEKPEALHALLNRLDGWRMPWQAAAIAREEIETRYGSAAKLYADACEAARRENDSFEVVSGCAEMVGGALRVVSGESVDAHTLFPARAKGPDLELSAEFAWRDTGDKQADFYLAYDLGKNTSEFIKVAIKQRRIVFFRQRHGTWKFEGAVDYESDLAASAEELVWHKVKINLDSTKRKLRVETTGGRWAEFQVSELVCVANTRCGVGAFGSVILFRNVASK
jgi:hypothetical protein